MKNKIYIGLIILLMISFLISCSLDRDYLNGPNASSFPSSKEEVESGVFGTYKGLTLIDAASTPFPGIQDNASDIGASRINIANFTNQQQSKIAIDNAWVQKVYQNIYKTAARANLVLDGMAKLGNIDAEQGVETVLTEEEYKELVDQIKQALD